MSSPTAQLEGFKLSPQQQRLWALRGEACAAAQFALRLPAAVDAEALQGVLKEILVRHEILRTTFPTLPGMPWPLQVIGESAAPAFRVENADAHDAAAIERLCAVEREALGDLSQGPTTRFVVLRRPLAAPLLIATVPALCVDARSLQNLAHEILSGCDGALPATEVVQYVDFAEWQEELLSSTDARTGREFWRRVDVADAATQPAPYERERVAGAAFAPEEIEVADDRASERSFLAAPHGGVSNEAWLFACWSVLLASLTGRARVTVGCGFEQRRVSTLQAAVGPYATLLPIVLPCDADAPFIEVAQLADRLLQAASAHQELYVAEPGAATAGSLPLAFSYEQASIAFERRHLHLDRSKLHLIAAHIHDRLSLRIAYDRACFARADIERLGRQLATLARHAAAHPATQIGDLERLDPEERTLVLSTWNATLVPYPNDLCLHQMFTAQARATPDRVAVATAAECLTYDALDRRANRLARHLRRSGAGAGTHVGILLERSPDMFVAVIGILKAGAAYVPLLPDEPPQRLARTLGNAGTALVVTHRALCASVTGTAVCCLDADWPRIADEPDTPVDYWVSPRAVAYVTYTSGSTGEPKGVMVEHRQAVNLAHALRDVVYPPDLSGLRVAVNAPLVFDASVKQWLQLLYGHTLCTVPDEVRADASALAAHVARQLVDVFDCTPTIVRPLLDIWTASPAEAPPLVLIGGEAIDPETWIRLAALDRSTCVNLYGPTECTVDTTVHRITRLSTPTIGRPLPNCRTYVLDRRGWPVPIGLPGELCIAGAGVARGYHNRPAWTAERFVPDPYSERPGTRMYRSGDRVRAAANGCLEFLDRQDDQVKIRGHRIELGEIEAVLERHPLVRQAAVVLRADAAGGPSLVACATPASDRERPDPAALRAFLQEHLSEFMVPATIVVLDRLPLTANGKLDRRALPALADAQVLRERPVVRPRTPAEELIAGIWTHLLGGVAIGADTNFFESGGHSLLATQVVSRIRQAFQVDLPLRALFEAPTVSGLADRVEALRGGAAAPSSAPMTRAPRDVPLPLSFAQQRLWFIDRLEGSTAYHVRFALRLEGPLHVPALHRAFAEIVRRHEVLRTCFPCRDGEPVQAISNGEAIGRPMVDLSGTAAPATAAQRIAESATMRPFDLERGPLVRWLLMRLADRDHVLVVTLHHVVCDGWSVGIVVRELTALYEAYRLDRPSPLGGLPIQYADFAVWQRSWMTGAVRDAQLTYWRARLEAAAPLDLPGNAEAQRVPAGRGGRVRLLLDPVRARALRSVGERETVSLFMTLLTGFQVLLARYTGQQDIVVGTDIANRNRTEIEDLIGFFVNQLVLRTHVDPDASLRAVLQQVREVTLGGYAHQDLPFESLVEALAPPRVVGRSPLFQVKLVLQNAPRSSMQLTGLQVSGLETPSAHAKFDLTLLVGDTSDGLLLDCEYAADRFSAIFVSRLLERYARVLDTIAGDLDCRVRDVDLLDEAEREQLLVQGRTPSTLEAQAAGSVVALFSAQVARTPDAVGIVFDGHQVTYSALQTRADQLAGHLRALGVGTEVRVGVCLERSIELIVGVLGVLKSGGVYVPLDPALPDSRLQFLADDASIPVVVTEQRCRGRLAGSAAHVIALDADGDTVASLQASLSEASVHPDALAYVIYTSGSTGVPKGVAIAHRALAGMAVTLRDAYSIGSETPLLQFASASFDAAVAEWAPVLTCGGRLVLASREELLPGDSLGELLRREAIANLTLPPTAAAVLRPDALQPLQTLVLAGEACHADVVARCARAARRVLNAYGPTEATICATIAGSLHAGEEPPPIGMPIAGAATYVLEDQATLRPAGLPGELYLGGAGIARGYLGQPALTAERFLPDPFGQIPGARLYRTGDRVRWRPDGQLEFLGRVDHEIKVRGYRIHPSEIEAVLAQHPAVRASVVVARSRGSGDLTLTAYVAAPPAVETAVLRDHVAARLPEYMVPAEWVILDALPLNTNGKVDRQALPEPGAMPVASAFVAPRTSVEEILAGIWTQVLRVPRVGMHDNFFEVGGDSILSVRMVARANQAGLPLTVQHIFQHQTIAALAALVEPHPERAEPEADADRGPAPLTPIQRWFTAQPWPQRSHFNQAVLLQMRRRLRHAGLRLAVRSLVRQHDALRLRLFDADGEVQQRVAADEANPYSLVDLGAMPSTARSRVLERACAAAQRSLDVVAGPLLRVLHVRLGENERCRLFFVIHHLAVDSVSWRILLDDVQTAYAQREQSGAIRLGPRPTSYLRWARALAAHAATGALEDERGYWDELDAVDAARLPRDMPDGENSRASARAVPVRLTAEETDTLLRQTIARHDVQMPELLLAALAGALRDWAGPREWIIDVERHGRDAIVADLDLSRTVGWFTTVHPLRLPASASLADVKAAWRGVPGRGIGYGLLRYLADPATATPTTPVRPREIGFNYLGQFDEVLDEGSAFDLAPEQGGPAQDPRIPRTYLLQIDGAIAHGRLEMQITYSAQVHLKATIDELGNRFLNRLRVLMGPQHDAETTLPESLSDTGLTPRELSELFAELDEANR